MIVFLEKKSATRCFSSAYDTYFHKHEKELNWPKGVGRYVKETIVFLYLVVPYLEHLHPHDGKHELEQVCHQQNVANRLNSDDHALYYVLKIDKNILIRGIQFIKDRDKIYHWMDI